MDILGALARTRSDQGQHRQQQLESFTRGTQAILAARDMHKMKGAGRDLVNLLATKPHDQITSQDLASIAANRGLRADQMSQLIKVVEDSGALDMQRTERDFKKAHTGLYKAQVGLIENPPEEFGTISPGASIFNKRSGAIGTQAPAAPGQTKYRTAAPGATIFNEDTGETAGQVPGGQDRVSSEDARKAIQGLTKDIAKLKAGKGLGETAMLLASMNPEFAARLEQARTPNEAIQILQTIRRTYLQYLTPAEQSALSGQINGGAGKPQAAGPKATHQFIMGKGLVPIEE